MPIYFKPKISTYFSENGSKKVQYEIEKRKKQLESSREILAKNIILPTIARYQFAEVVEIDF